MNFTFRETLLFKKGSFRVTEKTQQVDFDLSWPLSISDGNMGEHNLRPLTAPITFPF